MAQQTGTEAKQEQSEQATNEPNPKLSAIVGGASTGEFLKRSQEYAQHFAEKAREVSVNATEEVANVLRKYPIQSLVAGFGLGVLAGVLISRRA